jgi:hypothetical protein
VASRRRFSTVGRNKKDRGPIDITVRAVRRKTLDVRAANRQALDVRKGAIEVTKKLALAADVRPDRSRRVCTAANGIPKAIVRAPGLVFKETQIGGGIVDKKRSFPRKLNDCPCPI